MNESDEINLALHELLSSAVLKYSALVVPHTRSIIKVSRMANVGTASWQDLGMILDIRPFIVIFIYLRYGSTMEVVIPIML